MGGWEDGSNLSPAPVTLALLRAAHFEWVAIVENTNSHSSVGPPLSGPAIRSSTAASR